jgi:hypothetical protein
MKGTIPYHSETNPIAERVNRTIMTIASTDIIARKLPKNTWSNATQWAAYTKNRMAHNSRKFMCIPRRHATTYIFDILRFFASIEGWPVEW